MAAPIARASAYGRSVASAEEGGATQFVVSETGTAFYGIRGNRGFALSQGDRLLVVDLSGTESPVLLEPRKFRSPRWSPDGESVAYHSTPETDTRGTDQIFVYNVDLRTGPRQITFAGENESPVWSPDGSRLVFASAREGTENRDLYVKTINDGSPPEPLLTLPGDQFPTQWPRDDLILFEESPFDGGDDDDVWLLELGPDSVLARPYFESEADQRDLMIPPTGALAAYRSSESGTPEVYVRGFPTARQPELVSRGGGTNPFWSPDGRTLYYWTLGFVTDVKSVLAARIDPGPPFTVVSTDTVLTAAYRSDSGDLHPDGDRMILAQDRSAEPDRERRFEPPQFLVVTNWFEELRERLGGG